MKMLLNIGLVTILLASGMQAINPQCALAQSVSPTKAAPAKVDIQVTSAIPLDGAAVGTGSTIIITYSDDANSHPGLFLGRLVQPDGSFSKYMFLDEDKKTVYMSDETDTTFSNTSLQSVLRQYDQVDGTCTGYAIDHFIQQNHWAGFKGNGKLATDLSTEYGRTQLLVTSINDYYLATQHKLSIDGIVKTIGTPYGLKCDKKVFTESGKAIAYVETRMAIGMPVLISFWIGPDMVTSNLNTQDYESREIMDARLWVPRQIGERESGGHSVVAAGEFVTKGVKKLLMLDSDWTQPRIWDLDEYLGGKVDIAKMEFYSCDR